MPATGWSTYGPEETSSDERRNSERESYLEPMTGLEPVTC